MDGGSQIYCGQAWPNFGYLAPLEEHWQACRPSFSMSAAVQVRTPIAQLSSWENQSIEEAVSSLKQNAEMTSIEDFFCILQKCRERRDPVHANLLHLHICCSGLEDQRTLGNYLVQVFVECARVSDAEQVFCKLVIRNEYSWTSLIQSYAACGELLYAVNLFLHMQEDGVHPSRHTFFALLRSCARLKCLETGQQIHAEITAEELERDPFVGTTLVDMYAKCGSLVEAQEVFNNLQTQDVVSWNALITGYSEQGLGEEALKCLEKMQAEGVPPDVVTWVCSLKACASIGDISKGRAIYADIAKEGHEKDPCVGSILVDMYAKCGSLAEAQEVFDELPAKDIVSWTALMAGYAKHGFGEEALNCLEQMQQEGMSPDAVTVVCSLKACGSIKAIGRGLQICDVIAEEAFKADPYVGNMLVDMYVKFGLLTEAREWFNKLPVRDEVSWNTLMTGYAEHGLGKNVLDCLEQMQREGVSPNLVTYICSLKACGSMKAICRGQEIHAEIAKGGLEKDTFICTALVDMYAKCVSLAEAQDVFDEMLNPDVVSWNTLIAGYAEHGLSEEVLKCLQKMQMEGVSLDVFTWSAVISGFAEHGESGKTFTSYRQMQEQGILPNNVIFLSILKACGQTIALKFGKNIHAQSQRVVGLEDSEGNFATALVDMYGKCGSMVDAQLIFDAMPIGDLVRWNTLISGYARQGQSELVFCLFEKMKGEGIQPDETTYLIVLTACSHVGLVSRGLKYFEVMITEHGISPTDKHHNCMINLLSRAGQLNEAAGMLGEMPFQPNLVAWSTMLGACRKWGNLELGKQAFESAVRLEEKHAAAFTWMSNMYAEDDLWKDMEEKCVKSESLCS